ncbi:MAG: SulP family inorganic anion transporter [Magnetospiraceae bacterium]
MGFPKEAIFPFLTWISRVNRETLKADFLAGLTGAVIVLPQGVAFAMIAGLPPQIGLYTAMVTPIVAALFGSSMHLISGPTTSISIVVFAVISQHAQPGTPDFVAMALTLTLLAGVYQLALGIARLGILVNFVSHTVVIGFTAGAAILIATSQMKNFLGVYVPAGESFLHTWYKLFLELDHVNPYVLAVAASTLIMAIVIKKLRPKWPHLLIALIGGALFGLIINAGDHGAEMVAAIPQQLPPLSMPDFSFSTLRDLAPQAFAVALLGLIEAVSISRSIATKSHQQIDGNQEFIGQGLSNIVGSFFSSYAGSGSFTRSGINYSAGARTPFSAIFAAVILALIVLLMAPLAQYLPIGAMGGVILLVAFSLIDFKQIYHVMESSKSETAILLVTFGATLFLELEFAIYMGVMLSLVIFVARTSFPNMVSLAPGWDPVKKKKSLIDVESRPLNECPYLKILRIEMSIYFGSVIQIEKTLRQISERGGVPHILLVGTGINMIDLSGAEMLQHEAERLEAMGGGLYFVDIKPSVYETISRAHLIKEIGNNHFFDDKKTAIRTLQRLIRKQKRCEDCIYTVFEECSSGTVDKAA